MTVTMEDVAKRAGVSRALVSIVLREAPGASDETRERVLQAAADLDYRRDRRARLLSSSRSRTIGVVFGLRQEFHADVLEHCLEIADDTGFEVALGAYAPTRSQGRAVQALLDERCEAIVWIGPTVGLREVEQLRSRVPVVIVARAPRRARLDAVRTDDVGGARLATTHLIERGHRRIVHVDGGRAPGAAERRQGYKSAMRAAGLDPLIVSGGLRDLDGERAGQELLRLRRRPDAVAAFNDQCAAGLIARVRAGGRAVPDDLAVVGYDDSGVARLATLDLSTVAQDAAEIARRALERAIALSEDPRLAPVDEVVPAHLVVRGTSG